MAVAANFCLALGEIPEFLPALVVAHTCDADDTKYFHAVHETFPTSFLPGSELAAAPARQAKCGACIKHSARY